MENPLHVVLEVPHRAFALDIQGNFHRGLMLGFLGGLVVAALLIGASALALLALK
jgi:hypothetical protein